MAKNVFAKSGREKSVYYVGKIMLGKDLVDTGLTTAQFKSNKVLAEALDRGIIAVGLPDDEETQDTNSDANAGDDKDNSNEDSQDDNDYGLPETLDELKEVADSYGIDYGATIKEAGLTKKIIAHLDSAE